MNRRMLIAVIALVAAVVLAGCTDSSNSYGGDSSPTDTQDTQPSNQQTTGSAAVEVVSGTSADTVVTMQNTQFQSSPQVSAGDIVKFVNQDSYAHTVTFNGEGIDQNVPGGGSVTVRFNDAGTYDIVCTLHPGMETTVTAQ